MTTEYIRQWRAANPDKIRAQNKRKRARRSPEVAERQRAGKAAYEHTAAGRARQQRAIAKRRAIPTPCEGQPWTAEQDAVAIRTDLSLIEICFMLGRSYPAVRARRRLYNKACRSAIVRSDE